MIIRKDIKMIKMKSKGGVHTVTINGEDVEYKKLRAALKAVFKANNRLDNSAEEETTDE